MNALNTSRKDYSVNSEFCKLKNHGDYCMVIKLVHYCHVDIEVTPWTSEATIWTCLCIACSHTYTWFFLRFWSPLIDFQSANLASTKRPQVMGDLINGELPKGCFLGPFAMKPLPIFHINPIGFFPPKTPSSFRLITDLSQPSGTSVNDCIPQEAIPYHSNSHWPYPVQLRARTCSPLIQSRCKKCFLPPPSSTIQFPLMGIKFKALFITLMPSFPWVPPPAAKFIRNFLILSFMALGNVPAIVTCLDDHLTSDLAKEARSHLESFTNIASLISLSLADDKTAGPATTLEFLSIELDTMSREARLPETEIKSNLYHTIPYQ